MKNIIDDLKNRKESSFLAKKNVEKEINDELSIKCSKMVKKEKSKDKIYNVDSSTNDFSKSHVRTNSLAKITENTSSKLLISKLVDTLAYIE